VQCCFVVIIYIVRISLMFDEMPKYLEQILLFGTANEVFLGQACVIEAISRSVIHSVSIGTPVEQV
jgi:hypothetical protein